MPKLKTKSIVGDRYRIVDWIGEGGMQDVYRAEDRLLDREVALKVAKDAAGTRRFKKSAVYSARVNHNNVAKTLDYFEDKDRAYFIEELIEGDNLAVVAKAVGNFPPQAAAKAFHQLVKGVAASHHAGVMHRDLKPSNIMVVNGLHLDEFKVTDFGIAKMAEEELAKWAEDKTSKSSTAAGAVPYMAPESIRSFRDAGMPADVWAIGAICYELMCGSKPFGQGLESVAAILKGKPVVPLTQIANPEYKQIGTELSKLVMSCFEISANERPTADELMKEAERICYTRDSYELGHVKIVKNSSWGFLEADEGADLMYHRNNFYGDSNIKQGDRVIFARHDGLGNDRAFPIVKLRAS